jgi:hypothetical protein
VDAIVSDVLNCCHHLWCQALQRRQPLLHLGSSPWRYLRAPTRQQSLHQRCQRVGGRLANLPLLALHGLGAQPQDAR